jgi:hypothetical protein
MGERPSGPTYLLDRLFSLFTALGLSTDLRQHCIKPSSREPRYPPLDESQFSNSDQLPSINQLALILSSIVYQFVNKFSLNTQ